MPHYMRVIPLVLPVLSTELIRYHTYKYLLSTKFTFRKVPKFLDARKFSCNLPKIQTKRPNLRILCQKDANGIANSGDPDQTAPLGAV